MKRLFWQVEAGMETTPETGKFGEKLLKGIAASSGIPMGRVCVHITPKIPPRTSPWMIQCQRSELIPIVKPSSTFKRIMTRLIEADWVCPMAKLHTASFLEL